MGFIKYILPDRDTTNPTKAQTAMNDAVNGLQSYNAYHSY